MTHRVDNEIQTEWCIVMDLVEASTLKGWRANKYYKEFEYHLNGSSHILEGYMWFLYRGPNNSIIAWGVQKSEEACVGAAKSCKSGIVYKESQKARVQNYKRKTVYI